MNPTESARIIAAMSAAWPRIDWTDDTVALWMDALTSVPYQSGQEAAAAAVKTLEWPPTVAWFLAEARAATDRQRPSFRGAIGPGEVDRDSVKRLIAETRRMVRAQASRKHWHGGPAPCEVCGGINPNLAARSVPVYEEEKTQ